MPRYVAVYTVKLEDIAAFRALPKSEQDAIVTAGLQVCQSSQACKVA